MIIQNEQAWMPSAPSWLPEWVPWVILMIVAIAWTLNRFVFQGQAYLSGKARQKRDALELVKAERDEWQRRATELESKLVGPPSVENEPSDTTSLEEDDEPTASIDLVEEEIDSRKEHLNFAAESFENGEYDEGIQSIKNLIKTENSEIERLDWLAFGYYYAFTCGLEKGLIDLRSLSIDHPRQPKVGYWLSKALVFVSSYDEAKEILNSHLKQELDDPSLSSLLGLAIEIANKEERPENALELTQRHLNRIKSLKLKAAAVQGVAEIYKITGKKEVASALLEFALKDDPSNHSMRFDLAYLYGDTDRESSALYHYRRLFGTDQKVAALNNAGVAAADLELDNLSIEHYLKANELGNTLAAANLAYKLIEAGYFEEADKLITEAQGQESVHENVHSAKARIVTLRRQEKEKLEALLKEEAKQSKWKVRIGQALVSPMRDIGGVSGSYTSEDTELNITCDEDGRLTGRIQWKGSTYSVELQGDLVGRHLKFTWKDIPAEPSNTAPTGTSQSALSTLLSKSQPGRSGTGEFVFLDDLVEGYSIAYKSSGSYVSDPVPDNWAFKKIHHAV